MDPLDIDRIMQATVDTHLDAHTRRLTAAWVRAWEDVRAELDAAILGQVAAGNSPDAIPLDPRRVRAALDVIEERLTVLAEDAGVTIGASTGKVVGLGAAGQEAMIAAQLPPDGTWNRADPAQLDAIITRTTADVALVTGRIPGDTMSAIKRRLNRGVAVGDNPRLVADQIMGDVGQDFNGGLARALNIARTEMLDALRAAQKATDTENRSVLAGWTWVAHLDGKTCRSCAAMHGTVHDVDEDGPNDHHSGRCARVPRTKSWAELGFPGVPETTVDVGDATGWVESLSDRDLEALLTRRGADAYRAGEYPMSAWAERRTNQNWRDSVVPSRPPGGTR